MRSSKRWPDTPRLYDTPAARACQESGGVLIMAGIDFPDPPRANGGCGCMTRASLGGLPLRCGSLVFAGGKPSHVEYCGQCWTPRAGTKQAVMRSYNSDLSFEDVVIHIPETYDFDTSPYDQEDTAYVCVGSNQRVLRPEDAWESAEQYNKRRTEDEKQKSLRLGAAAPRRDRRGDKEEPAARHNNQ